MCVRLDSQQTVNFAAVPGKYAYTTVARVFYFLSPEFCHGGKLFFVFPEGGLLIKFSFVESIYDLIFHTSVPPINLTRNCTITRAGNFNPLRTPR